MVEKLKNQGAEWLDIQMVTPISKSFGGEEIPRDQFLSLLEATQKKHLILNLD
ncbi:MAG: hypothetical protein R2827_13855 [Bdellovibrionales bacterium]